MRASISLENVVPIGAPTLEEESRATIQPTISRLTATLTKQDTTREDHRVQVRGGDFDDVWSANLKRRARAIYNPGIRRRTPACDQDDSRPQSRSPTGFQRAQGHVRWISQVTKRVLNDFPKNLSLRPQPSLPEPRPTTGAAPIVAVENRSAK
eukprot:458841-Amorphochlora_amoeboformis.AAC.2